MNQKIIIDNPCDANWDKMNKNFSGRHCDVCNTTVVDFSKMSLSEIELHFRNNFGKKICGKYHERHVETGKSNAWFNFLNKIEFKFSCASLKKMAIVIINILLFISCKTKQQTTLTGRYYFADKPNIKTEKIVLPKKHR